MSGVLVIHVSGCFNLPGASISSSFFTVGHSQNYKWAIYPSAPLLKWSQQLEAQKRDQCPFASVALLSGYILKKAISLRNDSDTFLVTSWGKLYKIFHPHFPSFCIFFFFADDWSAHSCSHFVWFDFPRRHNRYISYSAALFRHGAQILVLVSPFFSWIMSDWAPVRRR